MSHSLRLTYLPVLGVFLLLAHPFPLKADTCLNPSPFQQQSTELTHGQRQTLAQLFRSLAGEWQGTSVAFFCASVSDPSDVRTSNETIKAKIEVDREDNLRLTAELYSPRERTNYSQIMELNFDGNRLSVDSHEVGLTEISQDTASFAFREERAATPTLTARTRDFFFTLQRRGNQFSIERKIYVQRKLSSGYTWQFSRP